MAWLMPAQMIINTASTIGYNNKLKQAVFGMKLGVNNEVNPGTEKAGLKLMAGGPSKINPSNPIHKAAAAESRRGKPPRPGAWGWNPTGNQLRPKLNKRSHRRKK